MSVQAPRVEASKVDLTTDGQLTLRVKAVAADGQIAEKTYGDVTKLVRYLRANRFGHRDLNEGGDDWALPSVIPVLEHYASSNLYNDISKMNGGPWADHQTHRDGYDVDGKYTDGTDSAHTAASAQRMLGYLNDPFGPRIGTVYVAFTKNPPDGFWTTIKNAHLTDGRAACRVFRNVANHEDHYHWRIDHADASGSC